MKFAHIADCHLGCWREPALRALGILNFRAAIERARAEHVGFVLISGDLFDVALPSIDLLREVADILRMLAADDISCYIIPGSHDFSPSGKTILDVLEGAGLVINVMRFLDGNLSFVRDDRTGVLLTGMYGRKGGLELQDYAQLTNVQTLAQQEGFKIFLFHTLLSELKPASFSHVPSSSISLLPSGFDYYAGGHPHFVFSGSLPGYSCIAYPGPLFPTDFKEVEELQQGGFFLVEVIAGRAVPTFVPLLPVSVVTHQLDVSGKHPCDIIGLVQNSVTDFTNKIVTLRFYGSLASGVVSDIDFSKLTPFFAQAYCVLRNISKVASPVQDQFFLNTPSVTDIERNILNVTSSSFGLFFNESEIVLQLLNALACEKEEGETVSDFERRVLDSFRGAMP